MKPDSHRVILNEQCCATCRYLGALSWLCRNGEEGEPRGYINRPEQEVCDEWEERT